MEERPWEKIFQVRLGFRSGEILSANDLSGFVNSIDRDSQEWVCRGLLRELEDDSLWNQFGLPGNVHDVSYFCSLFHLNTKTVQGCIKKYREGKYLNGGMGGAPHLLSHSVMVDLKQRIMTMKPRPTTAQLRHLLVEAARQTAKDRGKTILEQEKIQCISFQGSFQHYIKEYGLLKRKGQAVYPERAKAIADKRLVCSWIVVLMTTFGQLPGYKKWNSDQSMVRIEPSGTGMKVWIAKEEEVNAHDRLIVENAQVRSFTIADLCFHRVTFIIASPGSHGKQNVLQIHLLGQRSWAAG